MKRAMSVGLVILAVLVGVNAPADGGLFDRLRESFGGESVALQSDEPTPARPGPIVVPSASFIQTEEPPPLPVPDAPAPEAVPIELYPCVSYDDKDEMHPCAIPVVVGVPDPSSVKHPFYWLHGDAPQEFCATGCGTCVCCQRPPVYVLICVPPECPVPEPCVSHNGRYYTYDFGRYSVDVKLRRDEIVVEYDG